MQIKVCAVAAVSRNGVIGNNGDLPWRLPSDLKWFKQLTAEHVVIMGRKTWDSIPKKMRPLPGRFNIVVSRKIKEIDPSETVFTTDDLRDAISVGMFEARRRRQDKIFVIGGESLYNAYFDLIDTHYITNVLAHVEGDAKYPSINMNYYSSMLLTEVPQPTEADDHRFMIFRFDKIRTDEQNLSNKAVR